MKKQILILVFFVLATFASVNKSYGQLAPRAITCLTPDALHPIAGTPYTYKIDVPTIPGAKSYTWYATQNPNFIAAGVLTIAADREAVGGTLLAAAGATYNNGLTGTETISLTWKSFAYNPANPVFVVIYVTNLSSAADACTSENMKVYEIKPINAFSLDIANLLPVSALLPDQAGALADLTYGTNIEKCIHAIVTATWDATVTAGIQYDFGTDYMFYEVVAANFTTSWKPSLSISGIDALEKVIIEWDETKDFVSPHSFTPAVAGVWTGVWTSADAYATPVVSGIVGATGESIYVRVTLDHSATGVASYLGLADEVVILAVDGITNLSAAPADQLGDIHTVAGATLPAQACPWVDLYANDIATQTLNPRPAIDAVVPGTMPAPGLLPVKNF